LDREKCPIGATASNFVWQNDIVGVGGSCLTDIMRRDLEALDKMKDPSKYDPKWRKLFFVHAADETQEISYDVHRRGVVSAFEAGGVQNKTAKTQIYRTTRACDLIEKGVDFADVGLFQGWWHDTAADVYLKASIKAGPLLQAAGWSGVHEYFCWWQSMNGEIPVSLKALVFPGLDTLAALAKRVNEKTGKDLSAVKLCEVLEWLRNVFIEDAAVHRAKYPTFPAYKGHALFEHEEWEPYVRAEAERIDMRRRQWELRQRDPELAAVMKEHLQTKDDTIRELKDMVRELAKGSRGASSSSAAPHAPTEVEVAPTRPVPALFEPKSMADAFEQWNTVQRANFDFYADAGIPIPWKEIYLDKANTMRQRYHKMKPWLTYMDTVVAGGGDASEVIGLLSPIAAKYRVDEGVFIKDAFYHLVHPPSEKTPPRIAPHVLRAEMVAAKLPVPEEKKKREYKKREAL
jgi:hypothetical protein